jgi:hypothetical protein
LTVIACTSVSNSVIATAPESDGGGIYNYNGNPSLIIGDTIVANNTTLTATNPDVGGVFLDRGFNLVGVTNGSSGWNHINSGNQLGFLASPVNPMLGPLQDNGGPTFTMALLPGSPAIDSGKRFGLTTDQRGWVRPFDFPNIVDSAIGDGSDIGAFELSLPALGITRSGNTVTVFWQNAPGWSLQQNINLATPAGWSPNSNWTTTNGTNYLNLVSPTGNLFFRLKQP